MGDVLLAGLATAYLTLAYTEKAVFAFARNWADTHLLTRGGFLGWLWQWQDCRVCMSFACGQFLYWLLIASQSGDWLWHVSLFVPGFAAGAISALWSEWLTVYSKGKQWRPT